EVAVARLPEKTTTDELVDVLKEWNNQADISAILVQMPLPEHIDQVAVVSAIDPTKDVDGLHPVNLGLLLNNQPQLIPATAKGVIKLLAHYNISLTGRQVVVIGRSALVGQPTAALLSQAGATVTIAHR